MPEAPKITTTPPSGFGNQTKKAHIAEFKLTKKKQEISIKPGSDFSTSYLGRKFTDFGRELAKTKKAFLALNNQKPGNNATKKVDLELLLKGKYGENTLQELISGKQSTGSKTLNNRIKTALGTHGMVNNPLRIGPGASLSPRLTNQVPDTKQEQWKKLSEALREVLLANNANRFLLTKKPPTDSSLEVFKALLNSEKSNPKYESVGQALKNYASAYGKGFGQNLGNLPTYKSANLRITESQPKRPMMPLPVVNPEEQKEYERVDLSESRRGKLAVERKKSTPTQPTYAPMSNTAGGIPPPLPQKKNLQPQTSGNTYNTPKTRNQLVENIVNKFMKESTYFVNNDYSSVFSKGELVNLRIQELADKIKSLDTERSKSASKTSPDYMIMGQVITKFNKAIKENLQAGYNFYKEIVNDTTKTDAEKKAAKSEMANLHKQAKPYGLNLS